MLIETHFLSKLFACAFMNDALCGGWPDADIHSKRDDYLYFSALSPVRQRKRTLHQLKMLHAASNRTKRENATLIKERSLPPMNTGVGIQTHGDCGNLMFHEGMIHPLWCNEGHRAKDLHEQTIFELPEHMQLSESRDESLELERRHRDFAYEQRQNVYDNDVLFQTPSGGCSNGSREEQLYYSEESRWPPERDPAWDYQKEEEEEDRDPPSVGTELGASI